MTSRPSRRPATFTAKPGTIPRIQIGDEVYQGTRLTVTSYRDSAGRDVYHLTLVDAVLITEGIGR